MLFFLRTQSSERSAASPQWKMAATTWKNKASGCKVKKSRVGTWQASSGPTAVASFGQAPPTCQHDPYPGGPCIDSSNKQAFKDLRKRKTEFLRNIAEGKGPGGEPFKGHRDKWDRDTEYQKLMFSRGVCRDWLIRVPLSGCPDETAPRTIVAFDDIDFEGRTAAAIEWEAAKRSRLPNYEAAFKAMRFQDRGPSDTPVVNSGPVAAKLKATPQGTNLSPRRAESSPRGTSASSSGPPAVAPVTAQEPSSDSRVVADDSILDNVVCGKVFECSWCGHVLCAYYGCSAQGPHGCKTCDEGSHTTLYSSSGRPGSSGSQSKAAAWLDSAPPWRTAQSEPARKARPPPPPPPPRPEATAAVQPTACGKRCRTA